VFFRIIFIFNIINSGKILGAINGINLTSDFAFIGQYAVLPQYQGFGIGSALWKKVMQHIGTQRNISLYATKRMFQNYRDKYGFIIVPEKRIHLYTGKVNTDRLVKQIKGITLCRINPYNLQSVAEYDKQICDGLDRSVVIDEYSKSLETISLTAIENETNRVMGYCIVTATNLNTATAEPLYADNQQIAELLIGKCCDSLPITSTNGLYFQCWDFNEKAIAIATKMELNYFGERPILFTKQEIEGRLDKIFCVSSRSFYPF